MRFIVSLFAVLTSVPAFAADIICERQVTPNRLEFAVIDTWPNMRAFTGVKDCMGNGNVGFCFEKTEDIIIAQNQVCGFRMNTDWECRSRQRFVGNTQVIETECPRARISARLQIAANGRGRMVCTRNNRVIKAWNLGACY